VLYERYARVTPARNASVPFELVNARSEISGTFALTQDAPMLTNGARMG
jgi:hypothetical protein